MTKFGKNHLLNSSLALLLAGVFAIASPLWAASPMQVQVMISGGFSAAYEALKQEFEAASGLHVTTIYGPSMGAAPQAIPNRLKNGESADVVILADSALDQLIEQGRILPASKTDLARSLIAVAVKDGVAPPRIESAGDLAKAMTGAGSIAVSASASGLYVSSELIKKLGIEDEVRDKIHVAKGEPVGQVVARGEADLGFQQLSELQPIKGITVIGLLPSDFQKVTTFSAGIVSGTPRAQAGNDLILFLSSQRSRAAIERAGMTPVKSVE